jgi:DNA adenine methylase
MTKKSRSQSKSLPFTGSLLGDGYQLSIFEDGEVKVPPPPAQFLKWVGNKQRFAPVIAGFMPTDFERYFEPFVGSGAVLGTVAPRLGFAGDVHKPLIDLWKLLQSKPKSLTDYYATLWNEFQLDRDQAYNRCKDSYNKKPNPYDLLFLCRSCYAGIIRFRKRDGFMSTPIGPHNPISPQTLDQRIQLWRNRVKGTTFRVAEFTETMADARAGDLIYCDPPYAFSQAILYGAQAFQITDLWDAVSRCVSRGVKVMVSIDGHKKSGKVVTSFDIPKGIFKREELIDCGRSMLRRLQRAGETLEDEVVHDRLLLTW